ncbi:MAG: hydrogenase formation protein HypD [Candidatus Omnitrophota bacterium]
MLKFVDEYKDTDLCLKIAEEIRNISKKKMNIMEVCGGHTMAIRKNGIHKLIGENIKLVSGPGCPVCVTSEEDINNVIALCEIDGTAVCTFGDLFYVPGTNSSLAEKKAEGADVRVVYSVDEVLNFAKEERNKKFIFISIGFETTAPCIAAAILQAEKEGLNNFYILCLNKTMPNALKSILIDRHSKIDALICPGHVTAITGIDMYKSIPTEAGISCCVSGFEPLDILTSIYILAELYQKDEVGLVNAYKRVVRDEGNKKAQFIMSEVFEKCDASWRGIGIISSSGLKLNETYERFSAEKNFEIKAARVKMVKGCICGDILSGLKNPADCVLFGKVCTPSVPKGACMVSSEGACAAWYKYGE